jgi:CheY-like chemotaxis protein/anti-sigma regulatory factor (Ser/Thr protein kinase)
MELRKEPMWLEEMLFESIEKILPELRKKKLTFETCGSFFTQQYIGDAQHLTLILTHLLQNAVAYTDYGTVTLCTEVVKKDADNDTITFTITDTGRGMRKEQIKSVLDPYIRFSAMSDGAGTGLYIVSKLLRKMNGALEIESDNEVGTTLRVTVPLLIHKAQKIDLSTQRFLFFNDEQIVNKEMFTQLCSFLLQNGASVDMVDEESHLMSRLLDPKIEAPTCFVLTTKEEYYERYNGLIHYFKSLPKFSNTKFIAQHITDHTQVSFFDSSFSHYVSLSTYVELVERPTDEFRSDVFKERVIRILAVDDIATNLEVLKLFVKLIFPNAILDMAFGGYEAIGMYKSVDYDIILLDLKMPGLNGYDVIETFEKIKPIPPTFALTADVYKKTYEKISKSGFFGLLEKPIQPNILEEMITKALHDNTY